jgi:hypothetical protein
MIMGGIMGGMVRGGSFCFPGFAMAGGGIARMGATVHSSIRTTLSRVVE